MKTKNDTMHLRTQLEKKGLTLGSIYATKGIIATVPNDEFLRGLRRHSIGDWGEVCEEDWQSNDISLVEGSRILSVYSTISGRRFWIITEADRSSTTGLLPEEY